jgi:nitroimidazol reductase NimA-like FMN-containing flavoprotein (pyridoxamine 5'-phosphate oxidase superfamily)
MILATNRPDGWPQATTVGYVNDGLTIYFLCSPQSQKAANLAWDSPVTDPTEVAKAYGKGKRPEQSSRAASASRARYGNSQTVG